MDLLFCRKNEGNIPPNLTKRKKQWLYNREDRKGNSHGDRETGTENPEQKLCAQVSMLCRQKLLGYAESFEELGRSFHDEARIVGDDRQSILEKCLLQQSRQVMGDHLQTVARIMEQVAGEEMCYRPVEEKRRKNLVQALHSEGIAAAELCYIRKKVLPQTVSA